MRRLLAATGITVAALAVAPSPVEAHPTGCKITWYNSWPQAGSAGPCTYFQGSLAVQVFCTDAWGNGAYYYGPRIYTNGTSTRYCPTTRPDATFVGTSRTGH
jgi:hypothetical protein